jgi:glycine/D-amino acid oxidase-like deaminating enzyme
VWDLAHVLGAEVGASRAVIHAGWIGADRQVGQTGKTVRPALYIAAGISGAIQHRVGMEGADCIIALNNDPNAPIFDFAHYAIVGDAMQMLPALTRAFRQYWAKIRARPKPDRRRSSMSEKFDVIVVGAGPAGNAAAYTLAKAGLNGAADRARRVPGLEERAGRHPLRQRWSASSPTSATTRRWNATSSNSGCG